MKTSAQMVPILVILVALAVAGHAVAGPPPPPVKPGQQIHLFVVTVNVPDSGIDEEYNYRLLATVLGSLEAARSVMYETEIGTFSAFLTKNQARTLSKVPGVLEVEQKDYPVSARPETDGHH
ncbi:hypothetical protein ACP4OV_031293 [Aristida adscensionis]